MCVYYLISAYDLIVLIYNSAYVTYQMEMNMGETPIVKLKKTANAIMSIKCGRLRLATQNK